MRTQPNFGLRRFISTMAAMSCGPFGPCLSKSDSATTWRAPPRAEEFREGHEQMDRQQEQIAHELETILPANLHKTAPRRRFMPNLPIRHPHDRNDAAGGFCGTVGHHYGERTAAARKPAAGLAQRHSRQPPC